MAYNHVRKKCRPSPGGPTGPPRTPLDKTAVGLRENENTPRGARSAPRILDTPSKIGREYPNISQNHAKYIPNTSQTHLENILKKHVKNI